MIKWYSPKDKMPKIGDEIICFDYRDNITPVTMGKAILNKGLRVIEIEYGFPIVSYTHWAYVDDFNFPSEVKNE